VLEPGLEQVLAPEQELVLVLGPEPQRLVPELGPGLAPEQVLEQELALAPELGQVLVLAGPGRLVEQDSQLKQLPSVPPPEPETIS
jgi:hypothetical protein